MAMLNEIEKHVDAIMSLLNAEDCDEVVTVRTSRSMSVINLAINKETYLHSSKGEWKKI